MKKSLMIIITLAVSIVNLALMAVLVFAIVPAMKNTNELVGKIASAIDLELQNSYGSNGAPTVSIDDIEVFVIDKELTATFKKGEDGKPHYLVFNVSMTLNKSDPDYKTYQPTLEANQTLITGKVLDILSQYTMEEVQLNTTLVKQEILAEIQAIYQSSFIIDVGFGDYLYQ